VKVLTILLAVAMTTHAAPSDPGKVALDFLEKVRLRKLDLEPGGDTALSAQTAAEKRQRIARHIERMARDLGSDPLEVGAVKLDDNFAAVLVRKVGGFDPTRLQVFPVALVKRGVEWTAAPVPASFENSGTGYAIELRKRLELLENWMLRQQVADLEQLREQSASRMRAKIEASLPASEVRKMDSLEFSERFLAACEKRDPPSLLGCLGGLAATLPDDWPARLKAVERVAAAGAAAPRPWRLLTSPDVARVIVALEADDTGGLLSVACLDPAGSGAESSPPRIELVHLELAKSDDHLWQIDPPQSFLRVEKDEEGEPEEDFDAELRDAFPAKWIEAHPPTPQTTAESAHQALISALSGGSFPALLAISKLDGAPAAARRACIQAAKTGWAVQNPTAARHAMPLAFKADESAAVGVFQFFSARDPDRFDPRALYFEKSAKGWLWSPEPDLKVRQKLQGWVDAETQVWQNQWQDLLLADSPVLMEIGPLPAPSRDEAEQTVTAWLHATRAGDVRAALRLVARLGDPRSPAAVLQNLGYGITDSRRDREKPVVTGIYQGKTWTAVGVKIDQGENSSHPLYPVVQTALGPRILVEIDLFAAGNRGREFLNKTAFERLGKATPTVIELQGLYSQHQQNILETSTHKPR
jgi:hypothetical protein